MAPPKMRGKVKVLPFVLIAVLAAAVIGGSWYVKTHRSEVAVVVQQAQQSQRKTYDDDVSVKAVVGGEKIGFLRNPQVVAVLKDSYRLTVDATKAGSMEMVNSPAPGTDCIWPSNQVAVDMYRQHGAPMVAKENIFSSPVVFYAWDTVADALIRGGYASKRGESYYVDFTKLATALKAEKTWNDIGLPELYGKAKVFTTDPAVSNSGNMFAGLLVTVWNGGDAPTDATIAPLLPTVQKYFQRLGSMEQSSSDLFANFLQQGAGARPIIVSYENQLIEFSLAHVESQQLLRDRIRTMYPTPTVWSEHPLIAVTGKCKRLIEALKDPEVQKIAWEQHGFRSGLIGVQNDPRILHVTGIPEQVTAVIPMPGASVMQKVIGAIAPTQ